MVLDGATVDVAEYPGVHLEWLQSIEDLILLFGDHGAMRPGLSMM